jgi:cbb3-type cytochrome oxidase subunit 1
MPRLSTWFVRASLLHLSVGVLAGGLMLCAKGLGATLAWTWLLLAAHIQLVVGGWMIQATLGVAYYILPRLDGAGNRGRTGAATLSFVMLNTGIVIAACVLTLRGFIRLPWLDHLLLLAALLQAVAMVAFVIHAWPRVRTTLNASRRHGVARTRASQGGQ